MTTCNKFSQAAAELLKRRAAGTKAPRLNSELQPNCIDDALSVHEQMIKQRNDAVGGWKCLLPITDNQLVVAPIFSQTVQQGEICTLFADNQTVRIEPEIAFVLGKDLPAQQQDYSEAQIDEAVASCHMALELMQDRFAPESGVTFYEKLADCLVNQGLFIGPQIDKSKAYAASEISIKVRQADKTQTFAGRHPNQLPQNPLYWLINFMTKRGTSFKAGQAIISGSYAGIVEVDFDCSTEIEYSGLGKYTVEFKALS
ncbi:hydratase [Psychromonas aquimarina]|uniref:hydratase n=1 Tax=Psychromonas aquimarina TaxID=444919 RepID=UPI0004185F9F|nr:hydratase [Psychromonas aquimarina]